MANFLEAFAAEWFEFNGYFVRRNVYVGRRSKGGYECELDIVAFHPQSRHLIHIEPSMDSDAWERREDRYRKKFEAGEKYIPTLFPGIENVGRPDQVALLVYAARTTRENLAGGRIVLIGEFMAEVRKTLREKSVARAAIPEIYPILRGLQFACQYWASDDGAWNPAHSTIRTDARQVLEPYMSGK